MCDMVDSCGPAPYTDNTCTGCARLIKLFGLYINVHMYVEYLHTGSVYVGHLSMCTLMNVLFVHLKID